jgi:hypothetical protein
VQFGYGTLQAGLEAKRWYFVIVCRKRGWRTGAEEWRLAGAWIEEDSRTSRHGKTEIGENGWV